MLGGGYISSDESASPASGDTIVDGTDSVDVEGTNWILYQSGKLVIKNQAGMEEWKNVDKESKEQYVEKVTSVVIERGVTKIPDEAFASHSMLQSITIPDTVKEIGMKAFSLCSSLAEVEIPTSVTEVKNLAFNKCTSLKKVIIPSKATTIGASAFNSCSGLKEVVIMFANGALLNIEQNIFGEPNEKLQIKVAPGTLERYPDIPNLKKYENQFVYDPDIFKGTDWSYDEAGELTISSDAGMEAWCEKREAEPFFAEYAASVKIEDGVTYIGNGAFKVNSPTSYLNIREIKIPGTVKSIGDEAFYRGHNLKEIEIPDQVASIGKFAFKGCTRLNKVTMKRADPPEIGEDIFGQRKDNGACGFLTKEPLIAGNILVPKGSGNAYRSANNWSDYADYIKEEGGESPDIPDCPEGCTLDGNGNLKIASDKGMQNLIEWLKGSGAVYKANIKTVTIEDGVTKIDDGAFQGCSSLTSITMPASVTNIGRYAFENCSGLTSITMPGVKNILSGAFQGCTALESIEMPEVIQIGYWAFVGCSKLTVVKIPSGIHTIEERAFRGCTSLEEVIMMPSSGVSEMKLWENIFELAGSEGKPLQIKVAPGTLTAYQNHSSLAAWKSQIVYDPSPFSGTGWSYDKDGKLTISSDEGMTDWCAKREAEPIYAAYATGIVIADGVTFIGDKAFKVEVDIGKASSVEIPDSVTSIGSEAFYGCRALESIVIPKNVASIGDEAFICWNLKSVTMKGANPPKLTGSKGIFGTSEWGCKFIRENTTGITVPAGCRRAYVDDDSYGTGYGWRNYQQYIKEEGSEDPDIPACPEGCTLDENGNLRIASDAGMQNLIDWLQGSGAGNKANIKTIMIAGGVTTIGENAFKDCSGLTSITIPASVTGIGANAFSGCSGLTSITIPAGVTSIGANAFKGCSSLASVAVKGKTPPTLGEHVFGDTAAPGSLCKFVTENTKGIKVPADAEDTYNKNQEWSKWASYIAAEGAAGSDEAKVAAAKAKAEEALKTIPVTNETTKESLLEDIKKALKDAGVEEGSVTVTGDLTVTPATETEKGSVKGSITITSGSETDTVTVDKTIPRLAPTTPAGKVAAAKDSIEQALREAMDKALEGIKVTNANAGNVAADIQQRILPTILGEEGLLDKALEKAGVKAEEIKFSAGADDDVDMDVKVNTSTIDTEGGIVISIPVISTADPQKSDTAEFRIGIPTMEDEAKEAVEEAVKDIEIADETPDSDILEGVLNAVKETLGEDATVEKDGDGIERGEETPATEDAPGKRKFTIKLIVNGKQMVFEVTVTIKQLAKKNGLYIRFVDYDRLGENGRPCYKYTGAAVKPAVEIYNNDTLLTFGKDYTIIYKNNTKVSTALMASMRVSGKGSFAGKSNEVSFQIIKADIEKDTAHPAKMTVVKNTKVAPVIMNGAKKLTGKNDFILKGDGLFVNGKYAAATAEGVPNILTVEGKGGYEGSFQVEVTVLEKSSAKKFKVAVDKNYKPVYGEPIHTDTLFKKDANDQNGRITVTDSKNKETVLREGTDFTVAYASGLSNAGTVRFTVTGMGAYTGSVAKTFKIAPLCAKSTQFKVEFDNKEYEYKPSGVTVDNLKVTDSEGGRELKPNVDYKAVYSKNKKVTGEAGLKITFLGNYKGSESVSKTFKIGKAGLSDQNTAVIVPDKIYGKANKTYKSTPIVSVDGAAIKASEYTVDYKWATASKAGDSSTQYTSGCKVTIADGDTYAKVTVTITPKGTGNYKTDGAAGVTGQYYVRKKSTGSGVETLDLTKAIVRFYNQKEAALTALEYNGVRFYTPAGNDPSQNFSEDPNAVYVRVLLRKGTGKNIRWHPVDPQLYDVAWTNATEKGKATVVVTGKGEAGNAATVGSKTASIKITARKFNGLQAYMEKAADSLKQVLSDIW